MAGIDKRISLIVAALVVALLFYTTYWLRFSNVIAERIVEVGEEWRADGVQVHYSNLNVSGYPYRLQLAMEQVDLKGDYRSYDLWLNVPDFKITAHPWNLKHWVGVFGVPFQLGAEFLGRELIANISNGRSSLVIGKMEALERLSLQLNGVAFEEDLGEVSGSLDQLQVHIRDVSGAETEYDIGLLIRSLIVERGSSIDPKMLLEGLILEAKLRGSMPEEWEASSLHSWRTEGGIVDLQRLHFSGIGVDLELSGTVALDHMLRPIAAGTAKVEGYGEVLSAMNKSGLIGGPVTIAATLALDLLSTTSNETGQRVVQAPITVQDGILSVGPVALLHVGALIAP